ncbi:MAG: hypothetical protein R3F41_17410 [Gammaproteobacteria bacterium]|nr:hypothetical protein [Pseudomonadales bacterium]MCP5347328.1 hypothetical protein [Pseudomonadales bacterium]
MKNMNIGKLIVAGIMLVAANLAFAEVDADELRGRILEVDTDARTLTLRLIEVGANIDEPVDTIQTYKIPESVEIMDEFVSDPFPDQLGDLEEDEVVTVELDVEDRAMARKLRYGNEYR